MFKLFVIYVICLPLVATLLYAMHLAAPQDVIINIFVVVSFGIVLGVIVLSGLVMLLGRINRRRVKNGR